MLARITSAAVLGIDAYLVDVETDIANGLPSFVTVGLPAGAVKEGRERVNAAIHNAGRTFPLKRITVNLAPGGVPKCMKGPATGRRRIVRVSLRLTLSTAPSAIHGRSSSRSSTPLARRATAEKSDARATSVACSVLRLAVRRTSKRRPSSSAVVASTVARMVAKCAPASRSLTTPRAIAPTSRSRSATRRLRSCSSVRRRSAWLSDLGAELAGALRSDQAVQGGL